MDVQQKLIGIKRPRENNNLELVVKALKGVYSGSEDESEAGSVAFDSIHKDEMKNSLSTTTTPGPSHPGSPSSSDAAEPFKSTSRSDSEGTEAEVKQQPVSAERERTESDASNDVSPSKRTAESFAHASNKKPKHSDSQPMLSAASHRSVSNSSRNSHTSSSSSSRGSSLFDLLTSQRPAGVREQQENTFNNLQQLQAALSQHQQRQQQQVNAQVQQEQAIQNSLRALLQQQNSESSSATAEELLKKVQLLQHFQQKQKELLAQLENNKRMGELLALETARMSAQMSGGASGALVAALNRQQGGMAGLLSNVLGGGSSTVPSTATSVASNSTTTSQNNSPQSSPIVSPGMTVEQANSSSAALGGNLLAAAAIALANQQSSTSFAQQQQQQQSALEALQNHLMSGLVSPNLQQLLAAQLQNQRSQQQQDSGFRNGLEALAAGVQRSLGTGAPRSYPNGRPISGAIPGTENVGRWTPEEHERFLEGLEKHGTKHWTAIANVVKTRTVVQVRTHAQKYFKKLEQEGKLAKGEANSFMNGSPGKDSDDAASENES